MAVPPYTALERGPWTRCPDQEPYPQRRGTRPGQATCQKRGDTRTGEEDKKDP